MPGSPTCAIVLASTNPHKLSELSLILEEVLDGQVDLIPRPSEIPEVDETGVTLYDNALLKAEAICAATGMISIADDTGLFVAALDGVPGVFSARYAGETATYEENVAKLLNEMHGMENRTAVFRTVVVARFPDGFELCAAGEVSGNISEQARGTGGFGYDSVFIPDEVGDRTFAELANSEKNGISHRGRALRAIAIQLNAKIEGLPGKVT